MSERRAKAYAFQHHLLYFIRFGISTTLLLFLSVSGASHIMKVWACRMVPGFYGSLLAYLFLFGLVSYVVTLPLDIYEGFIVEHAFRLSNQSGAAWCRNELKKLAISAVMSGIMVEAFYLVGRNFPGSWWLVSALLLMLFSIGIAQLFPILIIPLFYKYRPLGRETLRATIMRLAEKFTIKIMDVFEIDLSKDTKKSNAAIVGWGATRRVILADNLVNEFSDDEIAVVLAHEFAHYRFKHIWKLLGISAVSTVMSFWLLSLYLQSIAAHDVSAGGIFDFELLPWIALFFNIFGFILTPLHNMLSCRFEREADRAALLATSMRAPFISLMEKLAEKNLSDDDPHPLAEFFFYDHPPIKKRIALAREIDLPNL